MLSQILIRIADHAAKTSFKTCSCVTARQFQFSTVPSSKTNLPFSYSELNLFVKESKNVCTDCRYYKALDFLCETTRMSFET